MTNSLSRLRYLSFQNLVKQDQVIITTEISPSGKYIVAISEASSILVWFLESGREFHPELSSFNNLPLSLAWIGCNAFLCGFQDGSLSTFTIQENENMVCVINSNSTKLSESFRLQFKIRNWQIMDCLI